MRIQEQYGIGGLTLLIFLIFSACEEPTKPDTTPPTVTITSPQNGSTVFEIARITCVSTDNEGVERVELWVDGVSAGVSDDTEPYSMQWNTTKYENGTHTISVRSFDLSGNKTDSEPIRLIIDNSGSYPSQVNIISITYDQTAMTIIWSKSSNGDFAYYQLLNSQTENSEKSLIAQINEINDTAYVLTDFNPTEPSWYWVAVTDTFDYLTLSVGYHVLDQNPAQIDLHPILYRDGSFRISWPPSHDEDFFSYKLYESFSKNMSSETAIFETNGRNDTVHTVVDIGYDEQRFYRIAVADFWSLQTSSSVKYGSSYQRIVFSKYVSGLSGRFGSGNSIHIIDLAPFHEPLQLLNVRSENPIWFPDGKKFLFLYLNEVTGTMRPDGSNLLIHPNAGQPLNYDISPDGSLIVMQTTGVLYTMKADGTSLTQITFPTENEGYRAPQISPDGSLIAFEKLEPSDNDYLQGIYTININGDSEKMLKADAFSPKWSPDGTKIFYVSSDGIYSMNADGSNQTQLSPMDPDYYDVYGTVQLSPDGRYILFTSDYHIYRMDEDGGNLMLLGKGRFPTWSPDGSRIVFSAEAAPATYINISIMNPDGSDEELVTEGESPQLQPRP